MLYKLQNYFRRFGEPYTSSPSTGAVSFLQPSMNIVYSQWAITRGQLKCDGTRAEIRFRVSAKRTSPCKSAGASVQSTTGGRGVRISGSNAGYIMFRGSVKSTGYPLHSPVSLSLSLPCVTVCHHMSVRVLHPARLESSLFCWQRIGLFWRLLCRSGSISDVKLNEVQDYAFMLVL
jgi:hypothetical protein